MADSPGDLDAALSQRLLHRPRRDQLGVVGVAAAVVAVVEREPRERAQVGPGGALAVEDRVVGEHPAGDPLHAGASHVTGEVGHPGDRLVGGAGEARGPEGRVAVADHDEVAVQGRARLPGQLAAGVGAGLQMRVGAELGEEGGGREQLLVRGRHPAAIGVVAVQRPVPVRVEVEHEGTAGAAGAAHRVGKLTTQLRPAQAALRGELGPGLGDGRRAAVGGGGRRRDGSPEGQKEADEVAWSGHPGAQFKRGCGDIRAAGGIIPFAHGQSRRYRVRSRAKGRAPRTRSQASVEDRARARRRRVHRGRVRDRRAASARPAGRPTRPSTSSTSTSGRAPARSSPASWPTGSLRRR